MAFRRHPQGQLIWVIAAAALFVACERTPDRAPTLAELKAGGEAKASGKWLMSVPYGMFRLDSPPAKGPEIVIGVHGYESGGYEWIYPLKKLGESQSRVYFYRWDWAQCPEPAADALVSAILGLVREAPDTPRIRLLAHSYGGVIAALAAARYQGEVPIEINVIATPLAGHPRLAERCKFQGASGLVPAERVTLRQWRTRKELDGAFRDLPTDPQVVDLPGEVTLLPETYGKERLGHNWSISWVADTLSAEPVPQPSAGNAKSP